MGGSTPAYVSLIEGVGSTFGLYGQMAPIGESQNILNCFWSKGLLAYPMGTTTGCSPLTVGINEKEDLSRKISLYPNPTYGKFQVSVSDIDTDYSEIEITDVFGKMTYHTVIKNKMTELDLSDQTAGVYFVRINDKKGNILVKKIIKE